MKRVIRRVALLVGCLSTVAIMSMPAASQVRLCYDINVVVNGETLVAESDCQELWPRIRPDR